MDFDNFDWFWKLGLIINYFDLLIDFFDLSINTCQSFDQKEIKKRSILIKKRLKRINFDQKHIKLILKSRLSTQNCCWNRIRRVIVIRIHWNPNLNHQRFDLEPLIALAYYNVWGTVICVIVIERAFINNVT